MNLYADGWAIGTQIFTPNGCVPIETLNTDDEVLSFDQNKGDFTTNKIVALHRSEVDEFVQLHIGSEIVKVSALHKIYLPKTKEWVIAKRLNKGDYLVNRPGNLIQVQQVQKIDEHLEIST